MARDLSNALESSNMRLLSAFAFSAEGLPKTRGVEHFRLYDILPIIARLGAIASA